jgi:DNA polymerase-3 subunit epsilon
VTRYEQKREEHLSTWGPNCGASLAIYTGHLDSLLAEHGIWMEEKRALESLQNRPIKDHVDAFVAAWAPLEKPGRSVFMQHMNDLIERRGAVAATPSEESKLLFQTLRSLNNIFEATDVPAAIEKARASIKSFSVDVPAEIPFQLKLERPLLCFDIESTGIDPIADRIVELGVTILNPDGTRKRFSQRYNPEIPIPPGATEVHGITDDDVKGCPKFSEKASGVWRGMQGKDLLTFNGSRFDLAILDEEFRRCGMKLDLSHTAHIDAFRIFQEKEPRNLETAVEVYCGRTHKGAHGAQADADATLDVLLGQLAQYEDLQAMSMEELASFTWRDGQKPIDLAGKLYRDAEGFACYSFGKAKDKRIQDDPGFGQWMLRQTNPGFSGSTCDALRIALRYVG